MASQDTDKIHTTEPLDSAADKHNCMVVQSVARRETPPGVTASFRCAGFAQTVLTAAGWVGFEIASVPEDDLIG